MSCKIKKKSKCVFEALIRFCSLLICKHIFCTETLINVHVRTCSSSQFPSFLRWVIYVLLSFENISLIHEYVTIAGKKLQNSSVCSALNSTEQGGILAVTRDCSLHGYIRRIRTPLLATLYEKQW